MTTAEQGEFNRWKGGAGEGYTIRYFLPEFFVMFEQPDIANFYDGLGWPRDVEDERRVFAFEVKTGSRGFSDIPTMKVDRWLEDLSVMPVILLRVEEDLNERPRVSFLVLHDWLVQSPNLAMKLRNKTLSFHPRYFRPADSRSGKQRFREAVEAELQRVRGFGPWAARQSLAVGLTEADMFRSVGRLSRFETPQGVLDEVLEISAAPGEAPAFSSLRSRWRDPPAIGHGPASQAWRREIDSPVPPSLVKAEANELRQFLRAVTSSSIRFPMPGHNWFQMANWRVFCLKYTASISLLERFFARLKGRAPSEVRAAVSLLSILADEVSGDASIPGRAASLLNRLDPVFGVGTVDTLDKYLVVRQYLFARAEGLGQPSDVARCQNFLNAHKSMDVDPEVLLHMSYYGRSTPQDAVQFVMKQLTSPKARQQKTAPILGDIVDRMVGASARP